MKGHLGRQLVIMINALGCSNNEDMVKVSFPMISSRENLKVITGWMDLRDWRILISFLSEVSILLLLWVTCCSTDLSHICDISKRMLKDIDDT